MAHITALRVQSSNPNRVSVFIDDEYAFGLHIDLASGLRLGQELSPEEVAALQKQDVRAMGYERALHYLSFRPRSAQEVTQYLTGKGLDEKDVAAVLERLQQAKLVDDAAFAQFWVNSRENARPKGAWALRAELRQKGIAETHIAEAVADVDEQASALRAAERKAQQLSGLDEGTYRRRLTAFLMRRGFGYDIVREAVDRLWDELRARP
mgnify:FL=1|jgi:regulatory protein